MVYQTCQRTLEPKKQTFNMCYQWLVSEVLKNQDCCCSISSDISCGGYTSRRPWLFKQEVIYYTWYKEHPIYVKLCNKNDVNDNIFPAEQNSKF